MVVYAIHGDLITDTDSEISSITRRKHENTNGILYVTNNRQPSPSYSNEIIMNGSKRLYSMSKSSPGEGKYNGKLKDILSSSRLKSEEKLIEADLTKIPIIRQSDNPRLLPKYTTILAKLGDDGVTMDDLDQLQQDLEKLLSTSAVRIRYLLSEIGEINRNDDIHERKAYEKTSLKRKRPDERPKLKDLKNGMRIIRKGYGLPVNKFIGDPLQHQDIPKVTLPKNDNSDKFWASIEPYCANITKDDIAFLDNLIQEFSKEIDIKVPTLGEHYTNNWTEEIINDEHKSLSKKSSNTDMKKNGLHAMVESFSTPLTRRLLAALVEERILNPLPKNGDNGAKTTNLKTLNIMKSKTSSSNQKVGICFDRLLKKELLEQGFLNPEDINKNMPQDEILAELKKCQEELITVNEYNTEELRKLKRLAFNELHSNELKEQLEKVDKQVLELYNKIVVMKKKAQQEEGDEFDKTIFTEQITKEFEAKADALLKQQVELNRDINGLMDMQLSY